MTRIRKHVLHLLCATAALGIASAGAQEWKPSKPIEIVVGFAAGGGTDVIARTIAAAAQEQFPVPLVIVNKPGAAGTLAAQQVAHAAPDGHTLLVAGGSESTSVGAHRDLPYDPRKDFTAIIRLTLENEYVAVGAKSPFKTLEDFVKAAKSSPGRYSHGSAGVASLVHSAAILLQHRAGLELKHVPYQGGAPAVQALVAGQIDMTIGTGPEISGQVEAGNLRVLGVLADSRSPAYPDVPTLRERGLDVVVYNMKGFVGPAGMPPHVVRYLHDRFRKAMENKAWQDYTKRANEPAGYLDGPAFQKAQTDLFNQIAVALKKN